VKFVLLKGELGLIHRRLGKRRGHFMNPALLQSQFDALEESKEGVVIIEELLL
jgi:Gluconate kinase